MNRACARSLRAWPCLRFLSLLAAFFILFPQRADSYTGHLRVYIVEPTSRWDDHDGDPYEFGFLDFAINAPLDISSGGMFTQSVVWDANAAGTPGVTPGNLMVIAAVFNSEPHQGYSAPPSTGPFTAYYVDAAAAATAAAPGFNRPDSAYTHTVFLEEATYNA